VGHALGGAAAGLLIATPGATARARWIQIAAFAAIGMTPDLDLLIGRHRLESHSIGTAVIAGAIAALLGWRLGRSPGQVFLAVAAAWFSHAVLDYLGADTSPPHGVMIWWPFSSTFHYAGLTIMLPISRRWWLPGTVSHNLLAALREVVLLGPLVAAVCWVRTGTRRVKLGSER
jgi:inner membrane protein